MKKFLGLLVATLFVSSYAFADVTNKATFTAEVSFVGDVTFSAELTTGTGTALTWDTTGINLDSNVSQWKQTTTSIKMTKSIGQANAKVYMYQNNKFAATGDAAKYVATTGRTEGGKKVYSGLVKSGTGGGEQSDTNWNYLPMAFYVSTSSDGSSLDFSKIETGTAEEKYGYRWFVDTSNEAVIDETTPKGYYTVANVDGYIRDISATGVPEAIDGTATTSTGYVFVAANFKLVKPGFSYGTNKILFDLVTE